MKRLIIILVLCFAVILIGAFYTLVDGIICGSWLGISMSLGCIVTLFLGVRLFKKMMTAPIDEEII
ncbi:MAG: hypothetical protein H7068_06250 [Pedobacter sp.]|nr:hypothetical protein [Chitinophagaceae bacterium]